MNTIVLTGGGTGGHVIPALALVPELKRRSFEPIFIGGNGMEGDLVRKFGLPFFSTTVIKFDRERALNNFKIPYILHKGVAEATEIMKKYKPCAVFSKGGYASLPSCLAAKKSHIPIVVHESDFSMGLANKTVRRLADAVLTSFPETKGGEYVGNPVRENIFCGDAERARRRYGAYLPKTLLIFGGSLGAEPINRAVYSAIGELTEDYNVIHIAGKTGDFSVKRKNYVQTEYCDDIADLFALSDVAVCRGGANSLSELYALGKRAVVIPLPKGTSRGDQAENAASYAKRGSFVVLKQEALTPKSLIEAIKHAEAMPVRAVNREIPNKKIVEKIIYTVEKH